MTFDTESDANQPEGDEDAPMDTGMPPGVHPNSDDPDPEVVKKAETDHEQTVEPDEISE